MATVGTWSIVERQRRHTYWTVPVCVFHVHPRRTETGSHSADNVKATLGPEPSYADPIKNSRICWRTDVAVPAPRHVRMVRLNIWTVVASQLRIAGNPYDGHWDTGFDAEAASEFLRSHHVRPRHEQAAMSE